MKAKDTVKKSSELCAQVCSEYRHVHHKAKDCDGLDCIECQLLKQAEISFKEGQQSGEKVK